MVDCKLSCIIVHHRSNQMMPMDSKKRNVKSVKFEISIHLIHLDVTRIKLADVKRIFTHNYFFSALKRN